MKSTTIISSRLAAALLFLCLSVTLPAQVIDVFKAATAKSAPQELRSELDEFGVMTIDAEDYAALAATAPAESWTLRLPAVRGLDAPLQLRLTPNHLVADGFVVRTAQDGKLVKQPRIGHHYYGEIIGRPGSRVALSLLDDELTATLTMADGKRLALGRLQTEDRGVRNATYLLFPDEQITAKQDLDCATEDNGLPYSTSDLTPRPDKSSGGCVGVYFEIDYDIYQDKGGVNEAVQHLAANFNEVKVLYADINVNMELSEVAVWSQPSPYAASTSGGVLRKFQTTRQSFNGDLAQLVAYHNRGGIAVLDGLCHPQQAARMSFSGISSSFRAVPTYSWSTMVIAHELGHLLGSRHTHACAWNGNGTAIDGCAPTEGSCGRPSVPANGGTIMSYCHLTAAGINFNFGFGPQPGAVIANRVADAQDCISATCSTGGGGGNPPPNPPNPSNDDDDDNNGGNPPTGEEPFSCNDLPVYVDITLDQFGMETTWALTTETGDTLATGGPYPKKQAGRIVRDSVCLTDDCYLFRIADEDGDGLCCAYGAGSFVVRTAENDTIVQGANFDSLAVFDFCLPFESDEEEGEDPEEEDDDPNDASCVGIDLASLGVQSYGGNQDVGIHEFTDGGRGIIIRNNAWKAVPIDYNMTANTWLSFWFRSTRRGEMHGIGMDNNAVLSADLTMRLYGTQDWGNGAEDNYPGDGEWKFYQIPIGQYYTLEAKYLFFTADHDVGTRDGNSFFRNVTITEGTPCGPGRLPAALDAPVPTGLRVSPNPASADLSVQLPASDDEWTYEVIDLTGKAALSGSGRDLLRVDVRDLPAGAYVIRCTDGRQEQSSRFVVSR